MKKLIILFFFIATAAHGQTATEKYNAFQQRLKTYDLSALPEAQQADTITVWLQLQAASIYEQAQAEKVARVADSTAQASATRAYITHLKAVGFKCDNSLADWRKAYGRPEWFGAGWETKAAEASRTQTLQQFIDFCHQYGY